MRAATDATVRDVMKRGVVTCRVDDTADEIARLLIQHDVSAPKAGRDVASRGSPPKCERCIRRFLGMAEGAEAEGAPGEEHPSE